MDYKVGQTVVFNVGSGVSPQWVKGHVTDTNPKVELSLFKKILFHLYLLNRHPMVAVRLSKGAHPHAGEVVVLFASSHDLRPAIYDGGENV